MDVNWTDEALADLKEALKPESGASAEDISAKSAKLSEESQKLGTAMYAAASEAEADAGAGSAGADAGAGAASGDSGSSDDDVVDAEVVEDDEEKK